MTQPSHTSCFNIINNNAGFGSDGGNRKNCIRENAILNLVAKGRSSMWLRVLLNCMCKLGTSPSPLCRATLRKDECNTVRLHVGVTSSLRGCTLIAEGSHPLVQCLVLHCHVSNAHLWWKSGWYETYSYGAPDNEPKWGPLAISVQPLVSPVTPMYSLTVLCSSIAYQ